jgi:hypothetical protein
MYQSDAAPWLEFFAWNTDGSAKTDLVYNTSGISIVVVRDNQANSSALTLSAASGPTDWAAGKFWAMGGNKYRVGIATASISSFTGKISVEGTYTGGVITGVTEYVTAYDPSGNPNTTSPPTAAAIADEVQTRTIARVTLVDTCTTNTDMRGTNGALTTLGANAPAGWLNAAAFASGAFNAVWTVTTRGLTEAVELDSATLQKIDQILEDTSTTLPAQIAGIEGGGGGGSATLEKQEEILAAIQGTEVIQVASPNVQGNLVLTQGDDYDGVANPRAQWNVTTDYTAGWTVRLTIRDADDAVVCTNTGSVVSATVVAVTIAAPTGLQMTGCPGQWQGKFDVELTHSTGKKKTIALGVCYINEDQTRD